MTTKESVYQEKMQELQKQLSAVMQAINSNSKVVAFMSSPVGQYLEEHPFVSLSLLVFVVMSAIPVGLFLILLVGTGVAACIMVILMEGVVMSLGGVALFCVLCVLAVLSFAISGVLSVCYAAISSLTNYAYLSRTCAKNREHGSSLQPGLIFSSEDTSVNSSKSD
ncbi:lipid droplet assembly factor 1 [Ambystoma mexicanum]|uniref:lipid droplet assembly factor 1 n=1 Tax=Ambystoma mexicanum TaxID=8296 RepID=UPI0037E725B1